MRQVSFDVEEVYSDISLAGTRNVLRVQKPTSTFSVWLLFLVLERLKITKGPLKDYKKNFLGV